MKGKIKWFNNHRGYGFIQDDKGAEYFVHYSEIIGEKHFKELYEGQAVRFNPILTERGPQATKVRLI